ncbi:OmpG porin family protein [Lelliottia sp. WAP21]|uniref:OmpG porin family protein n=1 Tax=Lelliottia sp. WAP21 TaxID=2877426 RepID=UPI001E61EC16|nr:OmpG porin family protein [Lelliottia sp. WAP21]
MDERLAHHHYIPLNKMKLPGRDKTVALFLSFIISPAFAENETPLSDNYTGNYQSYFHDEDDVSPRHPSSIENDSQRSAERVSSPSATSRPVSTQTPPAPSAAIGHSSTAHEQNVATEAPDDVSLLRLRQEAPPVHWDSIGRNMEAGGLHGNIGSQIEIDDVRWKNKNNNSGKFKLATIQAFLRHDELPNWYFGFWNAREDNYKGQFSNQDYKGTNTINELFVGHIFETWRGNIGTEVMVGSETATKRWKSRFKIWQDLRLSSKWSIAGYTYGEYQPQGNEPGNGDLEQIIFETEPAIQYRLNPDLGLYLRPYYYYNRQVRESWGDIVEQEWKVTAGLWRNWFPLLTSMYIGIGQDKIENASNANEVFYDGRYKFIGGTLSYPVFGEVRLYGEFKASFTKESGLWTDTGHSWNPFTVVGVTYNF